MEGSFLASSFHPPNVNPAAAATPARYPDWVHLDRNAYFADLENATTAATKASTGRAVKVTFCLADPPAVSHFCVHGPQFRIEDFDVEPRFVSSEKDLVLLRFAFTTGPRSTVLDYHQAEYFIVCNILEEDPFIYFIPLPKPGFNLCRDGDPVPIRDVSCYHGIIKFFEMEHFYREEVIVTDNHQSKRLKMTKDLDSTNIIYDSELLLLPQEDLLDREGEEATYVPDGWKIRTCYRGTSWDNWRKGHSIHVDDILDNNPRHSVLLPQLFDGIAGKSTLRNLITAFPCLSIDGDDVVYLMSKVGFYDNNAWIVGVDLRKQTVEMLEPYSAERASCFRSDFLPCAFSEFLNTTSRSCAEEATVASNGAQNRLHDLVSSGYPLNFQSMSPVLTLTPMVSCGSQCQ